MKIVKEHIEFERGLEPHEAMNIGIKGARFFQKLHSIAMDQVGEKFHTVSDIDWNYYNNDESIFTIHSMKKIEHDYHDNSDDDDEEEYTIYLIDGDVIAYYDETGMDLQIEDEELFKKFVRIDDTIDESIDFERGLEPHEAMNIGRSRKIKKGDEFDVKLIRLGKTPKTRIVKATALQDEYLLKWDEHYDERRVKVLLSIHSGIAPKMWWLSFNEKKREWQKKLRVTQI